MYDGLGGGLAGVKPDVHAGGRGKGGGVKLAKTRDEAKAAATRMFSQPLVTPQTGPAGKQVFKVIVAKAADIKREIYVGMVVDPARGLAGIIALAQGRVVI